MNREIQPALFRNTPVTLGTVVSPGEQRVSSIEVCGVYFRSELPRSAEECRRINYVASIIIASARVAAPALDVEF